MTAYRVKAFGLTDVGLVRTNNEDVWAQLSDLHLYALADGMGGHRAGEVAAQAAIETLCKIFPQRLASAPPSPDHYDLCKLLSDVICEVNHEVFELSCSSPALNGMGTTLCCLYLSVEHAIIAHVGDSRIYRLRKGKLIQMTKDHSLLINMSHWEGHNHQSSEEEMPLRSRYRSVITRAIGTEVAVTPSVYATDLKVGDEFLLCSDGLSDLLDRLEIEQTLTDYSLVEEQAQELIVTAKAKGGHDNITVVLVQVVSGADDTKQQEPITENKAPARQRPL